MEEAVVYNHIPGLPRRALLASLSCAENTAFKRLARLLCRKSSSTTLSLQVTWKQRKALYEGQMGHHPGMAFARDVSQHSSTATGHCLVTISHEVPAGWLHTGHLTLPLCTSKSSYFKIEIPVERVP